MNSSTFDEKRWVIQIQETLAEDDVGGGDEMPVSIFAVSKSLMSAKPESYIPQKVAIGPYHQWRSELYDMERHKFLAARRTQKQLHDVTFEAVVAQFVKHDYKIRACYDRYFDLSPETLAWMMAVDASFLLEFLQIYTIRSVDDLSMDTARLSQVSNFREKSMIHNAILRDIIMLENQIPLFLLREIFGFFKYDNPKEVLATMLMGLYKSLAHFRRGNSFTLTEDELVERDHLLGLLYYASVPKTEEISSLEEKKRENPGPFRRFYNRISLFLRSPLLRHLKWILKLLFSSLKFPLRIVGKIQTISSSNNKMSDIMSSSRQFGSELGLDLSQSTPGSTLIEEIMIPSVSELSKAGVKFCATKGNMGAIKFDKMLATLYLPKIRIDENSEAVLRNLVAYEAEVASGPLVFTRYTEFMNGIIDTEEDVKLLRENKIVYNHLKSDGEVADLWNGMSRSVKLTKVAHLDKVIDDVNMFYNSLWRVRALNLVKKYVFRSWPLLTFLAANIFLLLTSLQVICSFYDCSGIREKMGGQIANSTFTHM